MTVDDQTSRPLYRQVAEALRGRIERHELTPGGQLPTEANLMDAYGVSRNTIRLALGLLRTEGLVVTGQGRGSFVTEVASTTSDRGGPQPRRRVVDRHSLGRHLIEYGEPGAAERIDVAGAVRTAPVEIAGALHLPTDAKVVERRRVLYHDGRPSHTADTYVPEAFAGDCALLRPAPLSGGVAGVLERAGRSIACHVDEMTVRMPSPAEAQHLQIATGVPVMALLRTALDAVQQPLCTTVLLLPGDRHVVRYDVVVEPTVAQTPDDV